MPLFPSVTGEAVYVQAEGKKVRREIIKEMRGDKILENTSKSRSIRNGTDQKQVKTVVSHAQQLGHGSLWLLD